MGRRITLKHNKSVIPGHGDEDFAVLILYTGRLESRLVRGQPRIAGHILSIIKLGIKNTLVIDP